MPGHVLLTSSTANAIASLMQVIGTKQQRVAFITTALEREETLPTWFHDDKQALEQQPSLTLAEYTLTDKTAQQVELDLANFDILYVAGGNTLFLQNQILASKFADVARKHVAAGRLYIGQSAGAIVAGSSIAPAVRSDHAKATTMPKDLTGIGLVDFIPLPHWGSTELRDIYLGERLPKSYQQEYKIVTISNNQYVEVRDGWNRIVEI